MSYSYVVNSHKPTAVHHAIVCNFTSPTDRNLIIAKGNHIEIQTLAEDGLCPILDVGLFGRITALDFYRPKNSTQDVIFILTEKKHFSVIGFDPVKKKLITHAAGNVKDRVGRDIVSGQKGFIDPNHSMIAMLLYEGLLKIIPIESGSTGLKESKPRLKEAFNLRLDMVRFLDLKFLYGCPRPTICMLYEDSRNSRHIKTFVVDMKEKELAPGPWAQSNVEHGARLLIPVPSPTNGVIVVGEATITYLSGTGNVQSVSMQHTQICSCGVINSDGTRYILGDHRGILYVLVLRKKGEVVKSMAIDLIGTTSIAETLSYLDNGVVFVGSAYGDSQLIRLTSNPDESGNSVIVLDTYTNIGPVLDMCVVASERQGQSQVVTCSGAYKDGSLRVIRSGIGIHEQASIEMPGLKGLWSLRSSEDGVYDKFLVQSFIGETRVLSIDEEEMGETVIDGFSSDQQTLYCGNTCGDFIVQVVPKGVRLVSCETLQLIYEYLAPRTVTVAVGSNDQIVLALTGGEIIYLEVDPKGTLVQKSSTSLDQDIACLSLYESNISEDHDMVDQCRSTILAVGMWTDNSVRLFALQTLQELTRTQLGAETQAQARDVILVALGESSAVNVYLIIGLGDGTLITFVVDLLDGLPKLTNRRKVVLGTHPISLTSFNHAGSPCVFASCDRPTVLSTLNGKLIFSAVNIPEQTGMSTFHSELFPDCLALSSEIGLMIGMVDEIQRLHVQTHPMGESPRRIAHCRQSGAYAVTSVLSTQSERGVETSNRVLFLDDGGGMATLSIYSLDPMEQGISVTSCKFEGSDKEFIVVGTARVIPEEQEPSTGRIIVFEILGDRDGEGESKRRHNLVFEVDVKGAVFCIEAMNGKLVAAIGSKVQIFKMIGGTEYLRNYKSDGAPMEIESEASRGIAVPSDQNLSLQYECGHQGHILALYIKTHGDFVLVGDLLRSVTLLQYKAGDEKLEEVARDFNSNYMRAVEIIGDDEHFLGSDDSGNIFTVRRQSDAASDEMRSKMESQGTFHLGDAINVFRRGSLNSEPVEQESAPIAASSSSSKAVLSSPSKVASGGLAAVAGPGSVSILFGTISGAIGTIITLNQESFSFFSALERALKIVVAPDGGFSHDDWRSFHNERRSNPQRNIVDGDLVEQFLNLERDQLEHVVRQMNDDLATTNANSSVNNIGSTSSLHAILSGETPIKMLTIEECTRRVEDIARLH